MTQEQIQEQIAKFEKGLTNPNIPESAKETIKKKIEDLKSQIQKVEEVIEKKEEKIEKEEKAAQEDLEEVIKKFEKGLSNPNIPETAKDAMRKKIAAAKEKLAEAKKEMKEDKVEAEKEKKEIKKAVEKVEQLAKKAKKGKTPKKPAKPAKVKVEHKKREAKAEKRKSKIKGMTEDLMKIIRSNKYLKEKYAGKNVDLERDAHRAAKPFGYRFKGEHDLRDPKEVLSPKAFKAAVKSGRVYFEGRPNRSDKYPKGVPKHKSVEFADGGMMTEDERALRLLEKLKEEGKLKRYLDVRGSGHKVFETIVPNKSEKGMYKRYESATQSSIGVLQNEYLDESDVLNWLKKTMPKMADGGMMAKGGEVKVGDVYERKGFGKLKITKIDDGKFRKVFFKYDDNDKEFFEGMYGAEGKIANKQWVKVNDKMAKGGAVGKSVSDKHRFAKPAGYRWKDKAVKKGVVTRADLAHEPSKKMRKKYPNLTYFEDRLNKADAHPTRSSKDSI